MNQKRCTGWQESPGLEVLARRRRQYQSEEENDSTGHPVNGFAAGIGGDFSFLKEAAYACEGAVGCHHRYRDKKENKPAGDREEYGRKKNPYHQAVVEPAPVYVTLAAFA